MRDARQITARFHRNEIYSARSDLRTAIMILG